MTVDEMLPILQRWHDDVTAVESVMQRLADLTGMTPESCLSGAIYGALDSLTESVSRIVGDECEWLAWYWIDREMGSKGLDDGLPTDMREIRTLKDLAWVITYG